MSASLRSYRGDEDFRLVRQFIIDTFALYGRPVNWLIDRWNFCRYHVLPIHTFYNLRYFGVPTLTHPPFRDELPVWEQAIGIWATAGGEIAGVVLNSNEEPGDAWFMVHPDHAGLAEEMVDYAEERLADRVGEVAFLKLYLYEGTVLEGIAERRGYTRLDSRMIQREYRLTGAERPQLPDGYVIRSVAEEDDPDQRRMAKAIAFGANYSPSDWPPADAFRSMQKAPDYRPELDLFVKAPNGDNAAFCTIWVDERNRYGNFEPVGTRPEHRKLGLASALLAEGCRRMAALGVTRSFMDSNNPFYAEFGFRETDYAYRPWIRYL